MLAARKTVQAFEAMLGRAIALVDGPTALAYPDKIVVPFDAPDLYEQVEHELSHLVFKSDAHMREEFISVYATTLENAYKAREVPFDKHVALNVLSTLITILDDARVLSLWSKRYPGSAAAIQREWRDVLPVEFAARLHEDVGAVLHARVLGLALDAAEYPLAPLADVAIARVRDRGFPAVLVATKAYVKAAIRCLGDLSESASVDDRLTYAKKMLTSVDRDMLPHEDVQTTAERAGAEVQSAAEVAQAALRVENEAEADQVEEVAAATVEMGDILGKLAVTLRPPRSENDVAREHADEKLVFARPPRSPDTEIKPMAVDDRELCDRLRSIFVRELGRRRAILDDYGSAPDVTAYIQRRIARTADPIFINTEQVRGFTCLLLLDLSASMKFEGKYLSAQRAARVLAEALQFPFVDFQLWGYAGKDFGVTITRIDPLSEPFSYEYLGGTTPTHTALRAAHVVFAPKPGAKYLVHVSDGKPVATYKGPNIMSETSEQLIPIVRAEVDALRRSGVRTSSLYVDTRRGTVEVSDEACAAMMGDPNSWRRVYADEFTVALVDLVAKQFLRHLRGS